MQQSVQVEHICCSIEGEATDLVRVFLLYLVSHFLRNDERKANMSIMNGVVRVGMLEGMNTRKDPYVGMREVDMRKGRAQDLAHRFMSRGGYYILPDGS